VLEAATLNNAKACELEGKVGLVKEGYFADLIVVKEKPLKR